MSQCGANLEGIFIEMLRSLFNFNYFVFVLPVPVAMRSKAKVCSHSPAGILGLNPTRAVDVCHKCCVLSGRRLHDRLITCPEESYRLWCIVVCDLETLWMRRPWPPGGCCAKLKKYIYFGMWHIIGISSWFWSIFSCFKLQKHIISWPNTLSCVGSMMMKQNYAL
jgi:hypothetical protein